MVKLPTLQARAFMWHVVVALMMSPSESRMVYPADPEAVTRPGYQ